MAAKTLQFRGIGGEYLFLVQASDEFSCCDNYLNTALGTATPSYTGVGGRVYPGAAPETAILTDPTTGDPLKFITFRFVRADPDRRTHHAVGAASNRIASLYYEVLVWQQGKTYEGLDTIAAQIAVLLDVANVTTADGVIVGADRVRPARAFYTLEG